MLHSAEVSFQDPGNLIMLYLVNFHDMLLINMIGIALFVISIFIYILFYYTIGAFNTYKLNNIKARRYQLEMLNITHLPQLEFFWTIIPTLILINMALPTFLLLYYMDLHGAPDFIFKAIGNQWYWSYEYVDTANNSQLVTFDSYLIDQSELALGELRLLEVDKFLMLPANEIIRVLVTARDVLHSFALPALGLKMDAIPGRLNQAMLWTTIPGMYFGQCSELCGPNHGFMPITVVVTS
jgi:heme/copper-type cytochrome/quinol oxidase subunit 2